MRAFRVLLLTVLLLAGRASLLAQPAPAPPPPPTEQYLRVCEILNRADRGFAAGNQAEALATYREAAGALETFRKQYPGWNTPLLEVRVKHVGDRLKAIEQNPPTSAALAAIAPTPAPLPGPLPMPHSADVTNEFRIVLQELRAAEADNALLLAKLREALVSTPALLDPRELQRAEQSIATLKSQNDELRRQLEIAAAPSSAASTTSGSAETKRLRREIEDLNRKLKAQADAAVQLLAEKTVVINRQAAQLATSVGPTISALETEKALLQQQLQAALQGATNTQELASQLTSAQGQLAEAKNRIETLQRELASRPSGPTAAELERILGENRTLRQDLTTLQLRATELEQRLVAAPSPEVVAALRQEKEAATQQAAANAARATELEQRLAAAPSPEVVAELRREKEAATLTASSDKVNLQLQTARADVAALEQLRLALEAQLAASPKPEVVAELRSKNEDLQRQLTTANVRLVAAEARANSSVATITPAELEALRQRAQASDSDADTLRKQNLALQQQAARAAAQMANDAARIRELEAKFQELEQKLVATDRQLAGRSARSLEKKIEGLNDQVLALRARINVFETKAVRYTKEELALFQKPAANRLVAQKTLPAKTSRGINAELQTRGEAQLAAGELTQAEQTLTQVVQVNEKEIRAFCNLANSQAGQGKFLEAEATIQRALALAPNDASGLAILGYIRYSQGRNEEALDVLGRAATLKPKDPGIQVLLGVTLAEKGLRSQAETAFRKALQLQPNHSDAHRNLAIIYLTQQSPMLELARWHYQKAVANGSPPSAELERQLDAGAAPAK